MYIILAVALLVTVHLGFQSRSNKTNEVNGATETGLKPVSFSELPGWEEADTLLSLQTFQVSCRVFLKQKPDQPVGSEYLSMHAKDWHPACRAALALVPTSTIDAKAFFQTWFKPVEFNDGKPVTGLFTGYYLPAMKGSLVKTAEFNVPIYGLPRNLVTCRLKDFNLDCPTRRLIGRIQRGNLVPYYTRKMINQGAISKVAPVMAWVKSPIDRLLLEIEGSGLAILPNGKRLFLGYAGENGARYTAIGRVLIDRGVMTRDNASMQRIRAYLEANPAEMDFVLNHNESFVFFKVLAQEGALGSQGTLLTAGYSLAVDRAWVPMGTPIWLSTTRPDVTSNKEHPFTRLMIAQDTGGAIRGAVRGDVFWGAGKKGTAIAGKMKNRGRYWLLLPRTLG